MYRKNKQIYLHCSPEKDKKQIRMSPAFLGEKKGNRKGECQHHNILQRHNKKEEVNDTVKWQTSKAFKEQDQQVISNFI